MTIYISGPMKNMKDMNITTFQNAQTVLESKGYKVLNPHEIAETVNIRFFEMGKVADYEDYLREDIIQMLTHANTVLVLKGWRSSKGAKLEIANAIGCGIPVVFDIENVPSLEQ